MSSSEATVAVAVRDSRRSRRAAAWATTHLAPLSGRFLLVHVIPPVSFIPSPSGEMIPIEKMERHVAEMYVQDSKAKAQEVFAQFKRICGRINVETVVLEGDSPASALVRFVSANDIKGLVLGSSSISCIRRVINQPDCAATILKLMPNPCSVFAISRRRVTVKFSGIDSTEQQIQSISHKSFAESERNWLFGNQFVLSFLGTEILKMPLSYEPGQSSRSVFPGSEESDIVHKLRAELENTLAMYDQVCKDLVQAKKKIELLSADCTEEARKVKDSIQKEEILRQKTNDENALLSQTCKRYTKGEIEDATENFSDTKKIGEGSYGNVYKCIIDNTEVAVKVLRQDSRDSKKEEFLREVEILGQLSHPNMVSLLGFCPENGTLVYEYMQNGSLDDHLSYGNYENAPPLPWYTRFKIICETALALSFLHSTKPEPIVHRDLKPGNILLDRNFVSKIGDVGLAKLITEVVPDGLTEYRETVLAGTLYYMDPEYQRTGTVRPKSDLYALGIIMLQMLTGEHPNGLIINVESAVNNGILRDILDKTVSDWPILEVERFAKLALKCCRLKCRDRPDLDSEFLPEMREILCMSNPSLNASDHFICPILQEVMEDPYIAGDGHTYEHRAINEWLKKYDISPVTKLRLSHSNIIPNYSLRAAIQEWKSKSPMY